MRVLDLVSPGKLAWREAAPPKPGPKQVLVRVRHVGICGTDLHAYAGRQPFLSYPRRLGHELSVEMVRDGRAVACAVNPYLHCNACQACRAGRTNCCESLQVLGVHRDGGFAPLLSLPRTHVYPSAQLPAEVLALVEPLVVGRHAVDRSGLASGETALVVGAGPIGLCVALMARVRGASVVVSEARQDRRRLCREIVDAKRVLPSGPELKKQLRSMLGGNLPTVVLDATGNPAAMHASFDLAAHGGRYVFVGHYPGNFTFYDPDFHRRELTLLASRNGRHEDFLAVIRALERGGIEAMRLVTHRFAFDALPSAFARLPALPGAIKALVSMP